MFSFEDSMVLSGEANSLKSKNRFDNMSRGKRFLVLLAGFFVGLFIIEAIIIGVLTVCKVIIEKPLEESARSFIQLRSKGKKIPPQMNIVWRPDNNPKGWRMMVRADPLLGCRLEKNTVALCQGSLFITNDQGFSSIGEVFFHYEKKKPADTYRIIVMGGSSVWGEGAPTPDRNLPAQIQQKLMEKYPGKRFEVINAGVCGYNSSQELLYLMSELVYYQPDLVIVDDGANDNKSNVLLARFGENWSPMRADVYYDLENRLNESYTIQGSFFHFIAALIGSSQIMTEWWFLHKFKSPAIGNAPYRAQFNPLSVRYYKENLSRIIYLSKYHGFKLALFLQPFRGVNGDDLTPEEKKINPDWKPPMDYYQAARAMTKELGKQHNSLGSVYIGDLSRIFGPQSGSVFVDTGAHLNPKGNGQIADEILKKLAENSML